MRIVIAGAGEVGCHLAKMLSEGYHDITMIDNDEERLAFVSETMDVVTISGNPTSIDTLKKAGTERAELFLAVCPAKEQDVNIICALLAKNLGARKVACRINNDEYLSYENKLIFTDLGIDLLFYPEKIASGEICNLLKQSEMSETVDFAHGRLQMVVFRIDERSPLIDRTIMDFKEMADTLPFRIVAVTRGSDTVIPQRDTIFKLHDLVFFIVGKDNVKELTVLSGKEDITIKRLAILGGGRIGEMVAREFEKSAEFIKIIEINKARCEYLSETLDRTLVINGDGRNSGVLYEEDIKTCDAFVAVTSSSETNILACVAAKKMGVSKTIAEVENIEYITLAEEMGVDSIVNKKAITASRIFSLTLSNKVHSIKYLNGSDAHLLEFIVNPASPVVQTPLKDIEFPQGAIIGGILRGEETLVAVGSTVLQPYDRVAVFALSSALRKLEKLFA